MNSSAFLFLLPGAIEDALVLVTVVETVLPVPAWVVPVVADPTEPVRVDPETVVDNPAVVDISTQTGHVDGDVHTPP